MKVRINKKAQNKRTNNYKIIKYKQRKSICNAQRHTCSTELTAGKCHCPVLPIGYWRCEHLQKKMDTITNKAKNGTLHTSYF